MSIDRVQFQKGLSLAEFFERYGSEDQCHAALVALRWPDGFVCPDCGCSQHCTFVREERRYWQCSVCRMQFTVTCGTVFEATKLPLRRWFLAMHLMTQSKNNVSALELKRHLGVRDKAAWLMNPANQRRSKMVRIDKMVVFPKCAFAESTSAALPVEALGGHPAPPQANPSLSLLDASPYF